MKQSDFRKLKQWFGDICLGFSCGEFKKNRVYFRHFGIKDSHVIDECFNKYFDLAVGRGLLSEEDRLKELEKDGLWKQSDEADLENLRSYVSNLQNTKSKLFKIKDIQSIQKQIEEANKNLLDKTLKRNSLIGMVAEHYANKKTNDSYLFYCCFLDQNFNRPYFESQEEFDDTEDFVVQELSSIYSAVLNNLDQNTIQKICVSPFFQNTFYLAGENINNFFGKAIVDLTYYQIDCLRYGVYFREILKEEDIPDEYMDDPEKLIEFHNRRRNAQSAVESASSKEGSVVNMVGASNKELEDLGIVAKGETVNLLEKAKQSGGSLSMQDFIKLTGQ